MHVVFVSGPHRVFYAHCQVSSARFTPPVFNTLRSSTKTMLNSTNIYSITTSRHFHYPNLSFKDSSKLTTQGTILQSKFQAFQLMVKPTTCEQSSSASPAEYVDINSSKYKGVRKRKWGRWVSEIRLPNSRERIWLGSYDSAEKAARAFDAALFCLRGREAKFNFPENPPDIAGGRSLSTSEIQAAAARFAREVETGGDDNNNNLGTEQYTSSSSVSVSDGTAATTQVEESRHHHDEEMMD